ncbi:MAG: YbjN domain-containing protein [Nitrososphaerales archaeon]
MEPITKSFLGSRETWRDAKVELDDIHDLWGGRCITVYGDGTAFVKIVDLGQLAETYRMQLDEERVLELFGALLKNDVLAIENAERQPGADEICTRLSITNAEGETRTVCYWELTSTDDRFEDVRNGLSYVHDHMGDLGARLVAAVAPVASEEEPAGDGDVDSGYEDANRPAMRTNPELFLNSSGNSGETRSSLRALEAVDAFFTEDGWSFEQMPERPILRLPFQGKGGRWNCYAQIRVTRDVEQILFYSVLPLNVPADKLSAIAEFITRANYGMALGNFELDYNDGEVRYKTSIDVTDTEITSNLLRPLIYTNVLMMDKYMSGLMAVVYADVSPAEAVKQIEG